MQNKRDVLLILGENGKEVLVQKHLMAMSEDNTFKKLIRSIQILKLDNGNLIKPFVCVGKKSPTELFGVAHTVKMQDSISKTEFIC